MFSVWQPAAGEPAGRARMLAAMAHAKRFGRVATETRRGRRRFYLDFRLGAERVRIRKIPLPGGVSIAFDSESMAGALLAELRAKIEAGVDPRAVLAPYMGERSDLVLGAAWARFVDAKRRQKGLGARRVAELASYPRRGYFAPLDGMPAFAIGYADLEDLRDWLGEARGLAPKSVRHVVADLGTCLRWLARRREIPAAPELPAVRVPDHRPRIPSPGAMARILEAIPSEARGLFLARGRMGLRPAEARRACLGDWDAEGGVLTVRGKGDRVRYLPADAEVADWLAAQDGAGFGAEPLFPNPETGGRWSESATRRAWLAASRRAGEVDEAGRPRFRENEGLRHAFGTHAVNRGVTLDRAGKYMGHSDPKTTARYAKLSTATLGEVVQHRKKS